MTEVRILPSVESSWNLLDLVKHRTPSSWQEVFDSADDEFKLVQDKIDRDVKDGNTITPKIENIFKAFEYTPLEDTRVVIFGQDPYFDYNKNHTSKLQAQGMSFSVSRDDRIPSSLKNIYKEIKESMCDDTDNKELLQLRQETYGTTKARKIEMRHGELISWARQGVLLFNTALTVPVGSDNKRKHIGVWSGFVTIVIEALNNQKHKVVFVLLGADAKKLKLLISNRHTIIEGVHPSGLSANRGFFGSNIFVKIDNALVKSGTKPIDWNIG